MQATTYALWPIPLPLQVAHTWIQLAKGVAEGPRGDGGAGTSSGSGSGRGSLLVGMNTVLEVSAWKG